MFLLRFIRIYGLIVWFVKLVFSIDMICLVGKFVYENFVDLIEFKFKGRKG